MARTFNMSQFKSQIRQAQHKSERQLKQIQRDTERKMKNEINKAVNQYNRDVRRNQQKIQSELRKLNSSNKIRTTYNISVKTLNNSYNTVVENYDEVNSTVKEKEFFNYIESENANSLSVANAIENPELAENINVELQDNAIGDKLKSLSSDLNNRWIGALYSLNPNNPDATRHFCTSTREIFTDIFEKYALDKDVFAVFPNCDKTDRGNATRRSKIKYFLYKKGIDLTNADEFIDNDIDNILELYHTLSDGTHGEAGRYSMIQLKLIKKRVEDGINFLCEIVV